MAKENQLTEPDEQLNQALDELEALADADKQVVRVDSEHLKMSGIDYKIIENHQEAFDLEMMENRYTDYLLKYDYIVGDISYEKLRLRGFYEDYRKGVPIDMKIANLEDYLVEYCSFGSPYFVLERTEKTEADPESYFKKKKSGRSGTSRRSTKRQTNRNQPNRNKPKDQENRRPQKNAPGKKTNRPETEQKSFQLKRKESSQENQKIDMAEPNKQQPKRTEGATFEIRKKTD